jgi:cytochrome c oxidase subunit II
MITFLIILSIVLAVLAIGQLMRVFEATSKLRGDVSPLPTDAENKYQARMMLVFLFAYFSFFIYCVAEYGDILLPISASEHGVNLDFLLDVNFLIMILVFVITHIYLFYFAFRYVFNKDRKAYYYTHSNKLELLWTSVPAIFLAFIIIFGLDAWIDITDEAPMGSITIELYPKQFDWTARYAGSDSTLGASNYNMISGTNPLGLITAASITQMSAELEAEIADLETQFEVAPEGGVMREELMETIEKRKRQLVRVSSYEDLDTASIAGGDDDILVKTEFVIPKGRDISFKFRSRDVIHSAYMPHFRAQMNCVPGMITELHFKPTITTDEMRGITQNAEFEYILLCNKICGAAHYNMKMVITVVEQEEYDKWLNEQKTFSDGLSSSPEATAENTMEVGTEISMIEQ